MAEVVWSPNSGSQTDFLSCPVFECLYEGTRGPGKTDALLMDFAQFVGRGFGSAWRGILFRKTYKQLGEVETKAKRWFYRIFPGVKFLSSAKDYKWVWPTGEELLFRSFDKPSDYWDYHGHEYPWVGWEELTTWATDEGYRSMKACCRSSTPGLPRRYRSTTNPWGKGHNWVKSYFIDPAPAGKPVMGDEGLMRVRLKGHWSENKALLAAQPNYASYIAASASNPEQRKAWLDGSWDIVAGGMFDDLWDPAAHILQPLQVPHSWRIDRAYDWGSSKPFSVGWWAESDGTRTEGMPLFPRGSLVRVGEWYGWNGKDENTGLRMTDPEIAAGIVEREKRLLEALGHPGPVRAGPADSSIFDADPGKKSPAEEMAQKPYGVRFEKADKRPGSRVRGWQAVRGMLKAAKERDREKPGLWVFDTCRQFIRTVPTLPRSEKDPDDVDTEAEDHIGDETRYRVTAPKREAKVVRSPWS